MRILICLLHTTLSLNLLAVSQNEPLDWVDIKGRIHVDGEESHLDLGESTADYYAGLQFPLLRLKRNGERVGYDIYGREIVLSTAWNTEEIEEASQILKKRGNDSSPFATSQLVHAFKKKIQEICIKHLTREGQMVEALRADDFKAATQIIQGNPGINVNLIATSVLHTSNYTSLLGRIVGNRTHQNELEGLVTAMLNAGAKPSAYPTHEVLTTLGASDAYAKDALPPIHIAYHVQIQRLLTSAEPNSVNTQAGIKKQTPLQYRLEAPADNHTPLWQPNLEDLLDNSAVDLKIKDAEGLTCVRKLLSYHNGTSTIRKFLNRPEAKELLEQKEQWVPLDQERFQTEKDPKINFIYAIDSTSRSQQLAFTELILGEYPDLIQTNGLVHSAIRTYYPNPGFLQFLLDKGADTSGAPELLAELRRQEKHPDSLAILDQMADQLANQKNGNTPNPIPPGITPLPAIFGIGVLAVSTVLAFSFYKAIYTRLTKKSEKQTNRPRKQI